MNETNKSDLINSLNLLNRYIGSKQFVNLKMDPGTPFETRKILVALVNDRNELANQVINVLGRELSDNDPQLQKLVKSMKDMADSAENAQKNLEDIADKIETATQVAKFADQALQIAAGLAV